MLPQYHPFALQRTFYLQICPRRLPPLLGPEVTLSRDVHEDPQQTLH